MLSGKTFEQSFMPKSEAPKKCEKKSNHMRAPCDYYLAIIGCLGSGIKIVVPSTDWPMLSYAPSPAFKEIQHKTTSKREFSCFHKKESQNSLSHACAIDLFVVLQCFGLD